MKGGTPSSLLQFKIRLSASSINYSHDLTLAEHAVGVGSCSLFNLITACQTPLRFTVLSQYTPSPYILPVWVYCDTYISSSIFVLYPISLGWGVPFDFPLRGLFWIGGRVPMC